MLLPYFLTYLNDCHMPQSLSLRGKVFLKIIKIFQLQVLYLKELLQLGIQTAPSENFVLHLC